MFEPGNKLAKGGRREGAGRRPKVQADINKAAAQLARLYIAENIKPVLDNYKKLAMGWMERRYSPDGEPYSAFCYDGATTRHFVDKVLPDENETDATSVVINIAVAQGYNVKPDVPANGLQIHFGGGNGQNGNGSHGS